MPILSDKQKQKKHEAHYLKTELKLTFLISQIQIPKSDINMPVTISVRRFYYNRGG